MTKLLANKKVKFILGIILAALLVVTMFPAFQAAYGEGDSSQADSSVISTAENDESTSADEVEAVVSDGVNPEDAAESADTGTLEVAEKTTVDAGISAQAELNQITWKNKKATINKNDTVNLTSTHTLPSGAGEYTLTLEGTLNGRIEVRADQTLTIEGAGTINGSGGSAITVKGNNAKLVVGNLATGVGPTIQGGSGSVYKDLDGKIVDGSDISAGGGILVMRAKSNDVATLIVNAATITGNTAAAGGGIFVDRNCAFVMNGGTVSNNTASTHEGGGLYVAGGKDRKGNDTYSFASGTTQGKPCVIKAATISGNKSNTKTDWGGGGIFIESKGYLKIEPALINNNTARGLGGGISGCPHAKMGIGTIENAAIYGNHVNGEQVFTEGALWDMGNSTTGDIVAYKKDPGFSSDKAKDFYCTKASIVAGQSYKTESPYSWTGRLSYYQPQASLNGKNGIDITIGQNEKFAIEGASLGLTAAMPSNANYAQSAPVKITGNYSNTHGGGIGCNGNLEVGAPSYENVYKRSFSLEFDKQFLDRNDALLDSIESGRFEFKLYDSQDDSKMPIATAKNDANGKVRFDIVWDGKTAWEDWGGTTKSFYVKEVDKSTENADDKDHYVTFDTRWHKVDVTFQTIVKETSDGSFPKKITSYTTIVPEGGTKYYVENGQGGWTAHEGGTFKNKVKPDSRQDIESEPWSLELTKQFLSGNDTSIFEGAGSQHGVSTEFAFELFGAKEENGKIIPDESASLAIAKNDDTGTIKFDFVNKKEAAHQVSLKDGNGTILYPDTNVDDDEATFYTFFVREQMPANPDPQVTYDQSWHKVVVPIKAVKSEKIEYKNDNHLMPIDVSTITHTVLKDEVKFYGQDESKDELDFVTAPTDEAACFVNRFSPEGSFSLSAVKSYFGNDVNDAEGKFSFTMQRVQAPVDGKLDLATAPFDRMTLQAVNSAFTGSEAAVAFESLTYTEQGEYWYLISENDTDGVSVDLRQYVVKVEVSMAEDGMSLIPTRTETYYADGVKTETGVFGDVVKRWLELTKLEAVDGVLPEIEFANFNDSMPTMSVYGYAVNAASNEPIDQQCFVDPKIIKNLEGRALAEGEFNFKLIELVPTKNSEGADVVDWSATNGPTISETTNDRYGMVDFDKANNVGTWENPTCLQYTAPGTYYYRVVEANDTADPSINYSREIITFTTVIELNDQGQLECTDMYYGHVENGENIRYSESEDPQWHPTMTNTTRGMDLQVRKTSALDRDHGLEGATYGLYAVNDHAQADILLSEAVSDAKGWITFKDVNLTENTLYYFKERLAPAGHTVSEFRSSYFYLVKDASAPNGYEMKYVDNKEDFTPAGDQAQLTAFAEDEDGSAKAVAGPRSDDGAMLFTFAKDGGVYDEATRVDFTKLDTRTHEWVEGAKLSIIEKDTGKVVNSWTSGQAPKRLEGVLNVDTTYILREDEAPENYAKAGDVEFTIDQYGSVRVLSGTSNGNAELQDSTITLYDTMLDAELVQNEYRENVTEVEDDGSFLAKTGDVLKLTALIALAIAAGASIAFACRRKRQPRD